ncbi:MAG: hypothetical protein M0Z38_04810 [Deltaproteobacteria bacterium]|nr:hypothetical protein [Deltaproteobacteria bacterium]
MEILSGRNLTVLALALAALAAASAVRVAVSGDLRVAGEGAAGPAGEAVSAGRRLVLAGAAESSGDVTAALAHYRAAVAVEPRLVERGSPEFLGTEFEDKVNAWISGLKGGKIRGGPTALPDASYLFRRMYGGCG